MEKRLLLYSVIVGIILGVTLSIPHMSFSQTSKLVIASWGGPLQKAQHDGYFEPFEKETGIKIVEDSTVGIGKLKTMVMSGAVEWDVVDLGETQILLGTKDGLLEPIDFNIVKADQLLPQAIHKFGVATFYYTYGIGYSTRRYSRENHPRSWAEFWDVQKFPGRRTMRDRPKGNLEMALLADGVPPDKLYPLDVERAFKSFDKIKKHINVFWTEGAHPAQLLVDGEVDFASLYQGTLRKIVAESQGGAKADAELSQALLLSDWWAVPKGARNKEAAMKFIQFACGAKHQAKVADLMPISPTNPKAYDFISKERASILPTSPENIKKVVFFNEKWWEDRTNELEERWKAWMLK